MRHHTSDPQWMPEVIRREGGWPEMRWNRWSDWQVGDPRWRVHRLDTSTLAIAMIVGATRALDHRRARARPPPDDIPSQTGPPAHCEAASNCSERPVISGVGNARSRRSRVLRRGLDARTPMW